VYQSVVAPATMTLAYNNATVGGIHNIAIAPSGVSSTVTFTGFVENGAPVTTKTFTAYTVLTVKQLTTTSAEIVGSYTPSLDAPYALPVISSANITATIGQTAFTFVVSGVNATTVNTSRFEIYRNGILAQAGAGNDYTLGTITATNIPITWNGVAVLAGDKFYLKIR